MGLATAAGSLGQFVFAPVGRRSWWTTVGRSRSCCSPVAWWSFPRSPWLSRVAVEAGRTWRSLLCPPVTRFGRLLGMAATCCSLRDSSCAASTWRSLPHTCRRTSPLSRGTRTGVCTPQGPRWRRGPWRLSGCSTSWGRTARESLAHVTANGASSPGSTSPGPSL